MMKFKVRNVKVARITHGRSQPRAMAGPGAEAMEQASNTSISVLSEDLLTRILRSCDARSILRARAAASIFRTPGAAAISAIRLDAEIVPPDVWITYPNARVLVLNATSTKTRGTWVDLSMQLASAPQGRLQAVIVRNGHIQTFSTELTAGGALSTISSATVLGSSSISMKAASTLLALPSLKEARLHVVMAGSRRWRPQPSSALETLQLDMRQGTRHGVYLLDLAGLTTSSSGEAAQSNLQQLLLRSGGVTNISSLSSLTSLQSLSLQETNIQAGDDGEASGSITDISILAPLQQLRSLVLPQQCVQGPDAWRALAGLPLLQRLVLLWARLEDGDLVMGWSNFEGLTELEVVEDLELDGDLVSGVGGLRMCMPAVQQLRCANRAQLCWALGEQGWVL